MAGEEFFSTFTPILEGLMYVLIGLFIIAILGVAGWWWWNNLRYKHTVLIYDSTISGGGFYTTKGGAFVDRKTKNKLYYLKNDKKAGLDPAKPTFIHMNNRTAAFVFKRENGGYSWGDLNFTVNSPATLNLSAGDVDVNAAINHYDNGVKSFNNKFDTLQIVGFSIFGITIIGVVVMMFFLFKKFDVLADVAVSLKDAANALASSGTMVVAGA